MGVLNDPFFHIDAEPEGINAKGDYREKLPFNEVSEKLTALAVENQLTSVNDGMLCHPFFLDAYRPGSSEAEGNNDENVL